MSETVKNASDKCIYVLTKGNNKGQQCSSKKTPGFSFCKKHLPVDKVDSKMEIEVSSSSSSNENPNSIRKYTKNKMEIDENTEQTNPKRMKNEKSEIQEEPNDPKVKKEEEEEKKESKESKEIKVKKEPKEIKVKKEKKEKTEQKETKETKETKEPKVKKEKTEPKPTCKPVQICETVESFCASKNKQGNYELENGLVVDKTTKQIIGRQGDNGIINISIEDIEYCQIHGLRFQTPTRFYYRFSENEKKDEQMVKEMEKSKPESENGSSKESGRNGLVEADLEDVDEDEDMESDDEFAQFA